MTTDTTVAVRGPFSRPERGARVLIVDDDPDSRNVLARLLRASGFAASTAPDGQAALDALSRMEADVVLTDLRMPTMSGAELCERVHKLDPFLPVLVTSACERPEDVVVCLRAGANDYLTKPVDLEAILTSIDRALGARSQRRPASDPSPQGVADAVLVADRMVGGRYRLVRRLGRGGMSEVWLAEHVVLGTKVALKFLVGISDCVHVARARHMFHVEAQLSAQLSAHTEHVVQVYDTGVDEAGPYLVMERVRGHSLDALLRLGPLAVDTALTVVEQLGRALEVVHAKGVVHRDIKPANILVAPTQTGALTAKLADFGVATVTGPSPMLDARTGDVGKWLVGTPGYMSPEQLFGAPVDARSDLWALGVVVYEALTGSRPFSATSTLEQRVPLSTGVVAPASARRPGLPVEIDAWFERALAPEPDRRFASVREMTCALRSCFVAHEPTLRCAPEGSVLAAPAEQRCTLWDTTLRVPMALDE